ncbi:MAG: putative T7SS-secreted protein [Sporichthyaceae bacterium]
MVDLRVDTDALARASRGLRAVAMVAEELAGDAGRAGGWAAASGSVAAEQAIVDFLAAWGHGLGWIGAQAEDLADSLWHTAEVFDAIERRLAAAASAGTAPVVFEPSPTPAPRFPDPPRVVRGSPVGVAVQLSAATHWTQLIPGEPDEVRSLARRLAGFAEAAAQARADLGRGGISGWSGASAEAAVGDLTLLDRRLRTAQNAFDDAARACARYAEALEAARSLARLAFDRWQAAELASAAARGAIVGAAPVGGPADPDAELHRAAQMLAQARDEAAVAARSLVQTLGEAREGAPRESGFFAGLRRTVASVGLGLVEGVGTLVAAPIAVVDLVMAVQPVRYRTDPQGYAATWEAIWGAVRDTARDIARNPAGAVFTAVVDTEAFRDDPARAAGRLLPDLVALAATVGAAGAAKAATATGRLNAARDTLAWHRSRGTDIDKLPLAAYRQRLIDNRVNLGTPAGRAMAIQLRSPFQQADQWVPRTYAAGTRIWIRDDRLGTTDPPGSDAARFFENGQTAPERAWDTDGVEQPRHREDVRAFQVQDGGLDGATATALANPHLGPGSGTLAWVDIDAGLASGRLVEVDPHVFDPGTLRASVEDPRFVHVDDSLPAHLPLDPAAERAAGRIEGGMHGTADTVRDAAVVGTAAAVDRTEEETP